jgi:hypothetical protein
MKLVGALSCLCLLAPALAKNLGSINVKDYGEVYVCAPDWAAGSIQMHDNGFTMNGNSRLYFCSSATDGWSPDMYWQTPLNNKHFAYTLDLSNVGCHCNAAAYFINMPGGNAGDGDFYCDANFVNNQWCPEYDVMEGNKHTIACTLHTCNGGNGYWDSCDKGGCQQNAFNVDSGMMCPEDRCKINTNKPFVISHYQNSQSANTWMGQEGRDASFEMCNDGGYKSNMASSYGGMVFSASLWGGGGIDMGWLDGMTGCGGDCNIDGTSVTFTNFELWE